MIKKLHFCNILKLPAFGILMTGALISVISPTSQAQSFLVDPPCETTTCISGEMIGIAKGALVEFDPTVVNVLLLLHEPIVPCLDPRPTNVTVHKQIPREIEKFPDTFCTNQGCAPAGSPEKRICE